MGDRLGAVLALEGVLTFIGGRLLPAFFQEIDFVEVPKTIGIPHGMEI